MRKERGLGQLQGQVFEQREPIPFTNREIESGLYRRELKFRMAGNKTRRCHGGRICSKNLRISHACFCFLSEIRIMPCLQAISSLCNLSLCRWSFYSWIGIHSPNLLVEDLIGLQCSPENPPQWRGCFHWLPGCQGACHRYHPHCTSHAAPSIYLLVGHVLSSLKAESLSFPVTVSSWVVVVIIAAE